MKIDFFCPRWGSENIPLDIFCKKVIDAGYNGIEYAITANHGKRELDDVWEIFDRNKVSIIPQHYDTYAADFQQHADLFATWLEKLKGYPCVKIDSQTGKDFFTFEHNKKLIAIADASGLNIAHETHRNKMLFAAHISKEYFQKISSLRITLDASHWVCVAESYLSDQQEALDIAIERTDHIHARVGYPEGPQVPDPFIAEWNEALQTHLIWWDRIVAVKKQSNTPLTITPEFGPFPYMVHMPRTNEPVCDQWNVNKKMMEVLKKRYSL